MISDLWQSWQNNQWETLSKKTSSYDSFGNKLNTITEQWINNSWEVNNKLTYAYDSYGNSIDGKQEKWQNSNWILYSNFIDVFSSKNSIYMAYAAHYTAHFTSFTTGITKNNDDSILSIYPNPANDKITISKNNINHISIFDIHSKEVISIDGNQKENSINVNVSSLSKGIYFVQIKTNNGVINKKIVIE